MCEVCWRWSRLYRWTDCRRPHTTARQSTTACGRHCRWNTWDGTPTAELDAPSRSAISLVRILRTWCRNVCRSIIQQNTVQNHWSSIYRTIHLAVGKAIRASCLKKSAPVSTSPCDSSAIRTVALNSVFYTYTRVPKSDAEIQIAVTTTCVIRIKIHGYGTSGPRAEICRSSLRFWRGW